MGRASVNPYLAHRLSSYFKRSNCNMAFSYKKLITPDEIALFRKHMEGVQPLPKRHENKSIEKEKPVKNKITSPAWNEEDSFLPLNRTIPLQEELFLTVPVVEANTFLEFARPGVQTRVMRKLKRGDYVREALLDLHGFNLVETEENLAYFINAAFQRRMRCVQIIHGKGMHSGSEKPALKNRVNYLLRTYSGVLAFCSALPQDGGNGALYVLLQFQ